MYKSPISHTIIAAMIFFVSCATVPPEPVKPASPVKVEEVKPVERQKSAFEVAQDGAAILSQDGGNSFIYPGGALITFGDTFLGRQLADGISVQFLGGVSNCLMKLENKDGVVRYEYLLDENGQAKQFLPLKANETWDSYSIWPAGGVSVNGSSYVFYEIIDKTASAKGKGGNSIGLARSTSSWKQWDRLSLKGSFPFASPPHSVVIGKDGNLYLYFLEKRGDSSVARVAKVAANRIESPSAYTILDPVLATNVFGQVSVAWNDYLQSYVMCHAGHPLNDSRSIYIRRSQSPTGPFSEPERVLRLSDQPLGENFSGLVYCPYLYPDLFRDNGRVMTLSYCIREKHGRPRFFDFEVKR